MEVEKQHKKSKLVYIIVVFIILMIFITLALLYFTNENFKSKANIILEKIPFLNEEKNTTYSQEELELKKEELVKYYLNLQEDDAAYKLYAIKTKDELLYSDIVRSMNQKSPSNTERLVKKVRELEDMDEPLITIYNEIADYTKSKLLEEARRLENMELILAINELENRLESDNEFIDTLNDILEKVNKERIANILYYMDQAKREDLYNLLDKDLRTEIESVFFNKGIQYARLVDLAGLYENKSIDVLLNEIGNTKAYSLDELAVIYSNLSAIKAAEVLSRVNDDIFVQELFAAIRKEEQLKGQESTVANISKSIEFISEYNNKISELVRVYEKMEANKVAAIMERMLENNTNVTQLTIESEPIYEITDSTIVVDVLRNMKDKSKSNIISYMNTENATKLSQMLATP